MEAWSDPERRDAALERLAVRLSRPDPLSRTELAVLFLLSRGLTEPQIGKLLSMARGTVSYHVKFARAKLDARTATHAVAKAYRAGLIS